MVNAPLAVVGEGHHAISIYRREIGECNTTGKDVGHGRREQGLDFVPYSRRLEDAPEFRHVGSDGDIGESFGNDSPVGRVEVLVSTPFVVVQTWVSVTQR